MDNIDFLLDLSNSQVYKLLNCECGSGPVSFLVVCFAPSRKTKECIASDWCIRVAGLLTFNSFLGGDPCEM